MRVWVDGVSTEVEKTDLINSGGEALIFRWKPQPGQALKIYHEPNKSRARKLESFLGRGWSLPVNTCVPLALAHDSHRQVIGFTMGLLPAGFEPVIRLGDRDFCNNNGLTAQDVVSSFASMHRDLVVIHAQGLLVGDLSDINELFNPTSAQIAWIDADSWQFGQFPCPVAREEFLHPDLYNTDLSIRPCFRPEHDWYSWVVLMFIGLMRAHPFKGFHAKHKSIPSCALAGLTVFDPGVRYPKSALPPEVLTDELRELIVAWLKRQKAGEFPLSALEEYAGLLVGCKACGLWYPARLPHCPGCSEVTMLDVALAQKLIGFETEELIRTTGTILEVAAFDSGVLCLANEGGKVVLYKHLRDSSTERMELFNVVPGAQYALGETTLTVCPEPFTETPKLYLLDISGDKPQPISQTTTEPLAGGRVVFGSSKEFLYRLAGPRLMRCERFGDSIADREVAQALPNQTRFFVSPEPRAGHEIICGYMRLFGEQEWFLVVSDEATKRFTTVSLALPKLTAREALTEAVVRFSGKEVLILRQTRRGGVDYLRVELVGTDGEIAKSTMSKLSDVPHMRSFHGVAFDRGVAVFPTDDGAVKVNVRTEAITEVKATANVISSTDQLLEYQDGLLIVGSDRVVALRPK